MVNNVHDNLRQNIGVSCKQNTQFHKHIIWVPSLEIQSSGLALRPCLYQKDREQKGARK